MSDDDKQHEATPHRREEYRKEGRFARSRDAGAVAVIGVCFGVLSGTRGVVLAAMHQMFAATLGDLGAPIGAGPFHTCLNALAVLVVPVAVGAVVAGLAVGFAQAGFRFQLELAGFKSERLDPTRLGQMLSPKHIGSEVALTMVRLGFVGYAAYRTAASELPGLMTLGRMSALEGVSRVTSSVIHVTTAALVALAIGAAIDYAHSRYVLSQQMRMSTKELMDEMRSQDGDPKQKAKLRSRARAIAKKRAIANVRRATVVVTNPTHVAVALRYESTEIAPIVVAKGHDEVALRIREEARRFKIPIVENRPLARALDAEVQLGHLIPPAHFAAVARVLAFVMRLRPGGMARARA